MQLLNPILYSNKNPLSIQFLTYSQSKIMKLLLMVEREDFQPSYSYEKRVTVCSFDYILLLAVCYSPLLIAWIYYFLFRLLSCDDTCVTQPMKNYSFFGKLL